MWIDRLKRLSPVCVVSGAREGVGYERFELLFDPEAAKGEEVDPLAGGLVAIATLSFGASGKPLVMSLPFAPAAYQAWRQGGPGPRVVGLRPGDREVELEVPSAEAAQAIAASRGERTGGRKRRPRRAPARRASEPCPACGAPLAGDAEARLCRRCRARHHAACWEEEGACSECAGAEALECVGPGGPRVLIGLRLALASLALVAALASLVGLNAAGLRVPERAALSVACLMFLTPILGFLVSLVELARSGGERRTWALIGAALNGAVIICLLGAFSLITRR